MKTTVEIADDLYERTKKLAEQRESTFRELLETALRAHLSKLEGEGSPPRLRKHSFKGKGLQGGLEWGDWSSIRSLIYEDQGG